MLGASEKSQIPSSERNRHVTRTHVVRVIYELAPKLGSTSAMGREREKQREALAEVRTELLKHG
jgi:hypothetical protein